MHVSISDFGFTHALQNFATIPVSNAYRIIIDIQEQNLGAILTLEIHSLMNQHKDQDQMQEELPFSKH